MNAVLYYNSAENHRVDKTAYLEEVASLEGYLREGTSVLAPTIVFELPSMTASALIDSDDEEIIGDNDDLVIDTDYFYRFNYVYIPEFQRYYYVQDIVVARTNVFSVSMVCDVLMSFKNEILNLDAYIDRNEFDFDPLLVDELLPLKAEKSVQDDLIDYGDWVNVSFDYSSLYVDGDLSHRINIVISLVGSNGFSPQDYVAPYQDLPEIKQKYFLSGGITSYFISKQVLSEVAQALNGDHSEWASYFVSAYAYPFYVDIGYYSAQDDVTLQFGWDQYGNGQYFTGKFGKPFPISSTYLISSDIVVPLPSDFLDNEPYSQYEVYIPFCGWHKLQYDAIKGHRMVIYHVANFMDGSATAYLYDATDKRPIYSSPCRIGTELAITSTDAQQVRNQKDAVNANLALNLLSSVVSVGVGVATDNPVAIVGGLLNGAKSIANASNANALLYTKASASFGDSLSSLYTDQRPRLRITRNVSNMNDMAEYANLMGRPCRQMKPLYSLNGFTIVAEIHLDNVNAFKREKDEIDRLLKAGVIL